MALLKLNGVDVEVTDSEWEPVRLGEMVRSLNGAPRSTAKVKKANLRFTTGLLTVPHARALRGLVEGEGHVLSFEDTSSPSAYLYTSRAAAPSLVPSGFQGGRVAGRHGTGALRLNEPTQVAWQLEPSPAWTVLCWLRRDGGVWRHIMTSTNFGGAFRAWVNGALAPDELSEEVYMLPDGTLLASSSATGDIEVDEIVALPFEVPDAWVPALYAFHIARAWPALPYVLAEGPRFPTGGLLCLGEAGSAKARPLRTSVGEVFDFTLYGT